jgi:outer membrane murein-binding lipoprotein Lpp
MLLWKCVVPGILIAISCAACSQMPNTAKHYVPVVSDAMRDDSHMLLDEPDNCEEFDCISTLVRDLEDQTGSLRLQIDDIGTHNGSVDGAESETEQLSSDVDDLISRVQALRGDAVYNGDDTLEVKCFALEERLDSLLKSVNTLHDQIQLAQSDSDYRHNTGIEEINNSMDDVESNMGEVLADSK